MSSLINKKTSQTIGSFFNLNKSKQKNSAETQTSEAKFSAAFHACPDLMSITRLSDGEILDVNDGYTRLLGYTRAESIGKKTTNISIWADPADRAKFISTLNKFGEIKDFTTTLRRKDGTLISVVDSARTFDLQGQKCVLSVVHDNTRNKRAEQEHLVNLKFMESMDRVNRAMQRTTDLEQMMRNVLDVVLSVFDCDRAWLVYPSNPGTTFYTVPMERTKPEYPGAFVQGAELPVDPDSALLFQLAKTSSEPIIIDENSKPPLPDIVKKRFQVKSQMVINIYPKVGKSYIFGLHQCSHQRVWTTDEKRLFKEISRRLSDGLTSLLIYRDLMKSEGDYRRLIETANEGIWVIDKDRQTTFVNQRMLDMFGYTEKEMMGKKVDEFVIQEEAANHKIEMRERSKGKSSSYERRFVRKDRNVIWVHISGTPLFDDKNKYKGSFGMLTDITDRKKTEAEREQFFKFFNLSNDMMVIADPNGTFKKVNPACLDILGYSEQELLAKPFVDFVHPDDKQSTLNEMTKQVKIGSSLNFENRYLCKDGQVLWLSWRANYNKKEGVTYATARDVTDRKIKEIELAHKNRALKMVSDINQALIRITDENILLNDACRISVEIGGYRMAWIGYAESDKQKTVRPIVSFGVGTKYLDDADITWADDDRGRGPTGLAIRTGKTQTSSDILNDPKMAPWSKAAIKQGFKSSIALPLIDKEKTFGALTIYAGEINAFSEDEIKILEELASDLAFGIVTQRSRIEQKKMAEAIKKNEVAMIEAQRIGHFGNWDWDIKTDKINWSAEYYHIIGFDPQKAPPGYEEHLKIYTPESITRLDAAVKKNMKTGEPYTLDLEIATPNATCRWITARSETVYDDQGKITGLRGTAQDITQRKLVEQKLATLATEREKALLEAEKLAKIVENTFESVALFDPKNNNVLLYVNSAWEKMFGYKKSEVVNKRPTLLIEAIKNNPELKNKYNDCIAKEEIFSEEFEWGKKNGVKFWADVNIIPIRNEAGEISVWCDIIRDITEAKNVDRMKTEFVSLASHQLRTPLTGSKWFLELLLRDPEHTLTAYQHELIQGIVVSNERTITLVDDLLDVSRIDAGKNFELSLKKTDVISLINFAIKEKQSLVNNRKLTIELDKKIPEKLVITIDKEKIIQVFENLIDNAVKYSKSNTKIIIGIKINSDHVTFYIKDSGIGIPFVNQHKIFNKFFRADNAAKIDNTGTGLGLYIAKDIIEHHQGKIWFDSEEGKGSTFYVSLPLDSTTKAK